MLVKGRRLPGLSPPNFFSTDVMKCKGCGRVIDRLILYRDCWQYGTLKGKKLVDYGPVEEIQGVVSVECPECHEDLRGEVEL